MQGATCSSGAITIHGAHRLEEPPGAMALGLLRHVDCRGQESNHPLVLPLEPQLPLPNYECMTKVW